METRIVNALLPVASALLFALLEPSGTFWNLLEPSGNLRPWNGRPLIHNWIIHVGRDWPESLRSGETGRRRSAVSFGTASFLMAWSLYARFQRSHHLPIATVEADKRMQHRSPGGAGSRDGHGGESAPSTGEGGGGIRLFFRPRPLDGVGIVQASVNLRTWLRRRPSPGNCAALPIRE